MTDTDYAGAARGGWHGLLDAMPLGRKLTIAFAVALTLTAVLGASALAALYQVNDASQQLSRKWLPAIRDLALARTAVLDARNFEIKHTQALDDSYRAEYAEKRTNAINEARKQLKLLDEAFAEGEAREARDKITKHWQAYLKFSGSVIQLSESGKEQDVMDARDISEGASKSEADDTLVAMDKLSDWTFQQGQASSEQANSIYGSTRAAVIALLASALLISAAMALGLTRHLLRTLGGEPNTARQLLKGVAAGDLSAHIPVKPGDADSLMATLRDMRDSLATVVGEVREGAEHVALASREIAAGNTDLSSRTEQQASALEQTSASMTELGSTVANNAQHAHQADQLARGASQVANNGGQAVHAVVSTMRGINDSSRRIAEITSVIDGIAFQTNILALNAAVEAARAGEQGRGFAVVAGEVRSLAQRSATAAKEIKSLIQQTVEQIQHGSEQVDKAGDTIAEVVRAIETVSTIVGEISDASEQQRSGVTQVGEAIHHIDENTQRNAALVEQSAAAADSLQQEAGRLVQSVARFRLN